MESGTNAIAETRCRHQWETPDFADPRPRTRAKGVRMFMLPPGHTTRPTIQVNTVSAAEDATTVHPVR
jgi:hypothetical protein